MDIRLNYKEKGSGSPLILLHGNGESHEIFSAQMEFFSGKYRVIAVDTRWHGDSPRGIAEFTISQFADDLLWLFDELGLEKADILGFSDGGNIAMTFALRYPERVSRLILNGANMHPMGVRLKYQLPIIFDYLRWSVTKPKSRRRALYGLMVREPHFRSAELGRINVPTLVIAGTDDMIRHGHTEKIARSIRGSRLVFVDGDHFIAQKCPDEFNRAVNKFLDETLCN